MSQSQHRGAQIPPSTGQSLETQIANLYLIVEHMRGKMDDLYTEVREINRTLRSEHDALERRVRSLEEERIRTKTMLIPLSIILSAALSFGTQQILGTFSKAQVAQQEAKK